MRFHIADDILRQAVQGISDLIIVPGLINLDFADVKTVMQGMGMALMGTGTASGENRAVEAAKRAISSRCWKTDPFTVHSACLSTSRAAMISACMKSAKPPESFTTLRHPTPTSSLAPCSTRR
jgi:hypothetical protein